MSEQNRNYEQIEEITLHFGKGTVEPFTAKDGREMLKIVIPNADRSDHTPWASFVLPAKAVHENQYGKDPRGRSYDTHQAIYGWSDGRR